MKEVTRSPTDPAAEPSAKLGRAEKKAVVRDDAIVIRPVMEVSLCFDHRASDGGHGQRFMQRIRQNLEQPIRFLAM